MDQAEDGALPPIDDIPEARRDSHSEAPSPRLPRWWVNAVGSIVLLVGAVWLGQGWLSNHQRVRPIIGLADFPGLPSGDDSTVDNSLSDQLVPTQHTLLGHRPYEEAPADELTAITADGRIQLRSAAAEQFQAMAAAAYREGVTLVPLSGFRSEADQTYLFFGIKAERGQRAQTRAEVSAPPGYSEHHTGYAIDIGDSRHPETNLKAEFQETAAYAWLIESATAYGFELSFEADNEQGIEFEPWHWRFVGDRHSLETFYQEQE